MGMRAEFALHGAGGRAHVGPAWWLLAILIAFVLANAGTLPLFPTVWGDEVMFTDPAANLALDGRFVSTAWPDQPDTQLWASNAPLYSLLLAGWICLFGLSVEVVRLFGLVLMAGAVALLWQAARRCDLLRSPWALAGATIMLLCDYGVVLGYRSGRYDALGILLVALALSGLTREGRAGRVTLFAACALMPLAGLQLVMWTVIAGALGLLVFRWAAIPALVVVAIGLAVGITILVASLASFGVLDIFIGATNRLRQIRDGSFPKDPSFVLLVAAAMLAIAVSPRRLWRDRRLQYLAVTGLGGPMLLYLLGRLPTYYTWMAVLPLSGLLAALAERGDWIGRRVTFFGITLLMVAACASGWPLQIASGLYFGDLRDYRAVEMLVPGLGPRDVVVTDPSAYYAVRPRVGKTYVSEYLASGRLMAADRARVTVIVAPIGQGGSWAAQLGGRWTPGARSPVPSASIPLFSRRFGDKLVGNYALEIWHRDGARGH